MNEDGSYSASAHRVCFITVWPNSS